MATTDPQIPIAELTTEQPESTDPDYLAWKRRTIEAALRDDDAHPDNRRPLDDVAQEIFRKIDRADR